MEWGGTGRQAGVDRCRGTTSHTRVQTYTQLCIWEGEGEGSLDEGPETTTSPGQNVATRISLFEDRGVFVWLCV